MAFSPLKFRILLGVGVGFVYVAVIFIIVGLSTNYWLEIRDRNVHSDDIEMHFGLHRVCWKESDRCNIPNGNYDKQNFLPKVHGLVITGAIFGLAASLVTLTNLFREFLELRLKFTAIAATILSFIAGFLVMIGCALFGEKIEIDQDYGTMFDRYGYKGYSFGLTTCAGAMLWVGALLTSITCFLGKNEDVKELWIR